MSTSEKFCLKWNDFKDNICSSFASLREDTEFTDVTLACEDGQQVTAHKVILAASSPFFQNLFKINKHPHPLIYMRGVKYEDLVGIIDFLYNGEATMHQENINTLLVIAEELKLKGLTNNDKQSGENNDEQIHTHKLNTNKMYPKSYKELEPVHQIKNEETNEDIAFPIDENKSNNTVTQFKETFSGELQDLDEKIKSMWLMIRRDGHRVYICQVCGKEARANSHMRDHMEANHIEGIAFPCNICEKTCRSREALRKHKSHSHKV